MHLPCKHLNSKGYRSEPLMKNQEWSPSRWLDVTRCLLSGSFCILNIFQSSRPRLVTGYRYERTREWGWCCANHPLLKPIHAQVMMSFQTDQSSSSSSKSKDYYYYMHKLLQMDCPIWQGPNFKQKESFVIQMVIRITHCNLIKCSLYECQSILTISSKYFDKV